MSRKLNTLYLSGALILSLGACAAADAPQATTQVTKQETVQPAKRPNVLFISIDDLRPDLGTYGHPISITPNMDSFAASGLLFERAYTSQAVCAPSRAALMTGLRPDTTGIQTLRQPIEETIPDAITMAHAFKNDGYETVSVGKIYHHHDDDKVAWSKPNFNIVKEVRAARRKMGDKDAFKMEDDPKLLPDVQNLNQAVKEMRRLDEKGKPFFLAVGFHKPHLPFYAPTDSWANYELGEIPDPVSRVPQKNAPDYALVSYEVWNYENTPTKKQGMDEENADKLRHGYLAAVNYIDGLVGDLLGELEVLGLEDDTIVVLWSDHGFKLGDYGAWAKHSNAEMDIRIPMMIRVPGQTTPGTRTDALVETVDLYPTLAELAGVSTPNNLEGLSLTPLFANPDREWKQAAFAQFNRGKPDTGKLGRTVRTERYRYTAWVNGKNGKIMDRELYDHEKDPNELVNVAGEKEYKDVVKEHEALREAGWTSVREAVAGE